MKIYKVIVENAVFYAYHGATQEQMDQGQRFSISAEVILDADKACTEDDLGSQLNYVELYHILQDVTQNRRFNLMQSLALSAIEEIRKKHPEVMYIKVSAGKTRPPWFRDCCKVVGGGGMVLEDAGMGVTIARLYSDELQQIKDRRYDNLENLHAHGMNFWGNHGLTKAQNVMGLQFQVDIDVKMDMGKLIYTDQLSAGLTYSHLFAAAQQVITQEHYKTIEKVAHRILEEVKAATDSTLYEVAVTVSEPAPAIPDSIMDYVGFQVTEVL